MRIWLFKKCIKGAKGRGRRDGEKETGQEAAQITANVNNVQPQTDTVRERERQEGGGRKRARKSCDESAKITS